MSGADRPRNLASGSYLPAHGASRGDLPLRPGSNLQYGRWHGGDRVSRLGRRSRCPLGGAWTALLDLRVCWARHVRRRRDRQPARGLRLELIRPDERAWPGPHWQALRHLSRRFAPLGALGSLCLTTLTILSRGHAAGRQRARGSTRYGARPCKSEADEGCPRTQVPILRDGLLIVGARTSVWVRRS